MDQPSRRGLLDDRTPTLEAWLAERDAPAYRAGQIRRWLVQRRASAFAEMTDLPAQLRSQLETDWRLFDTTVVRESIDDDGTTKLLLGLSDGQTTECVLIPEGKRRTVCLSTQVGCAMGCVFCASGLDGVERSLTAGEMIEQLLHLDRRVTQIDELLPEPHPTGSARLNHIVVMGMGEPLANLDQLLVALEFATNAKEGLGISARNITISTVGLPAKIRRLASAGKQYHLAVSLHASNDRLRQKIVPMAEKISLDEILEAADHFRHSTGRQVTFEYVLLGGVNDEVVHARELARLLRQRDALVNLIPFNAVKGLSYRTPSPGRSLAFAEILRSAGYTVKIRKRKGSEINAACGQLRRTHQDIVPLESVRPTGPQAPDADS